MKNGFTLAEVLITLMIIGVIAMLTIPNLMQKHQEQEMITRLKKAHSVLSNAYAQAIRENGSPDDWDIGLYTTAEGSEKLYNYLKPYLKIQKDCNHQKGCFATKYKALFNDTYAYNYGSINTYYYIILNDGMSVQIDSGNTGCTKNVSKTNKEPLDHICGFVWIDVNGVNGPNRVGVDLFSFLLTLNGGVVPYGVQDYNSSTHICSYKNTLNTNGGACTAWALYKGNMDYLRKDISW